ncbi:hypothetical protein F2Q69_00052992 [Brassica cretica]|uniref:Uncharacterized protein n=1 Tax=Brassica cretica TaxID=69181 RepID=A0A8S9MY37_BRACR|nr:hypothetical protein F2Q69_00052992 [Brassica cretica]
MFELATQMFGVVRGPRDVCSSDADDVSAGYSEVPVTHMVFVQGYKDVCTIDAAGGCAGVQRHTVLATQRDLFTILLGWLIFVGLPFDWSRRHRPRRNRSPDETARASRSFASARVSYTRRHRISSPPLSPPFHRRIVARPSPGRRFAAARTLLNRCDSPPPAAVTRR